MPALTMPPSWSTCPRSSVASTGWPMPPTSATEAPAWSPMLADTYLRSGKVRDLYSLPDGRLALVAADRISAFDVVLPTEIPDKGRVLTGLSRFWFGETAGLVPNHLLSTETDDPGLRGRIMICRRVEVIPVEAVVRGYLAGSGWKA